MIRLKNKSLHACVVALLAGVSFFVPAAPQDRTKSDSSHLDSVSRAVVQLLAIGPGAGEKNRECSATGFLINKDGYILTNAHVIQDAKRCLAGVPGAKILAKLSGAGTNTASAVSCDLVALDDLHDLAVLKTERPLPTDPGGEEDVFVTLHVGEVSAGAPVAVTGHPMFAWQPLTQTGKVLRRATMRLSDRTAEVAEVLVLNMALRKGSSGSPVYLEAGGDIVGVVERQDPSYPSQTVAVSIRYAVELLNHYGVKWHASRK